MWTDPHHSSHGGQTSVSLTCPRCGTKGDAIWEMEKWGPSLASLSEAFYERLAKFSPYRIEIVCHGCGHTLDKGLSA